MADGVFMCHGVEWFGGDTCLLCEGTAKEERERIIKLLEEERKRHKEEGLLTAAVYLKDLISLIKGENK